MKTTFYYSPGVCSMIPRFALNYLEIPYEPILVPLHIDPDKDKKGDKKKIYDEFLKINPIGQVPVLKEDDFVLAEGAAILIYILEKKPNTLLTATKGQQRATELQWLMFFNASLHPSYAKAFAMNRKHEFANEEEITAGRTLTGFTGKFIQKHMDIVEKRLEKSTFLAGDRMTIGDVGLTIISNWRNSVHENTKREITFGPKTLALFNKVLEDPVLKTTLAQEEVTLNFN